MSAFYGIDGCRAGWFAASAVDGQIVGFQLLNVIDAFMPVLPTAEITFIDIPIGLASAENTRDIDAIARKRLTPYRHSSVFNTPCREAVYSKDLESAKQWNIRITGKSISAQSWNIVPKIREIDRFIQVQAEANDVLYEAHPELCFAALNSGPMKCNKKTREGVLERLEVLSLYEPNVQAKIDNASRLFRRNEVTIDDMIDAFCLAICASLSVEKGPSLITQTPPVDSTGKNIRLAFYEPKSGRPSVTIVEQS